MAEKMGEVYEAYDMQIESIGRGRGAIILRTDKGIRQIASLSGTDERLQQEKDFKDKMYDKGFCYIDRVIPNVDDEIVTCDRYGNPYVCREYFEGRECSFSNIRDLEKAVLNLALLHKAGRELYIEEGSRPLLKMPGNLDRKVRELRRIRNFIRDRNSCIACISNVMRDGSAIATVRTIIIVSCSVTDISQQRILTGSMSGISSWISISS